MRQEKKDVGETVRQTEEAKWQLLTCWPKSWPRRCRGLPAKTYVSRCRSSARFWLLRVICPCDLLINSPSVGSAWFLHLCLLFPFAQLQSLGHASVRNIRKTSWETYTSGRRNHWLSSGVKPLWNYQQTFALWQWDCCTLDKAPQQNGTEQRHCLPILAFLSLCLVLLSSSLLPVLSASFHSHKIIAYIFRCQFYAYVQVFLTRAPWHAAN